MLSFIKNGQHQQSPTPVAARSASAATAASSFAASTSAQHKRAQTWIEGWAVLGHRGNMVSHDAAEAWAAVMRAVTKSVPAAATMPVSVADDENNSSPFSPGFHPDFAASRQQNSDERRFMYDLEAEQVVTTHRAAEAALVKLRKDQSALRGVVARATEALDLGEGLAGVSVGRVRGAMAMIEATLQGLRQEEQSLGDVVGDAERVVASVMRRMLPAHRNAVNNVNNSSDAPAAAAAQQQRHVDPAGSGSSGMNDSRSAAAAASSSLTMPPQSSSSSAMPTADERLRRFLDRVGGRTFGWPKQEHDVFMHVLFAGGFEDAGHTHATPHLGLRLADHNNFAAAASSHQQQQEQQQHLYSLADDDAWVVGRIIERLTPMLPHRLPDDIKRHFCLQRELEFLEGQRRLEVRSWRDQREADAALDLGVAAALARTEQEQQHAARRETDLERRQRQEQLHHLVDEWRHKKDVAAATAAAAMAMTQRAIEDARSSRRQAIQAASAERNKQLLERRQLQKGAALWSSCARQLGASASAAAAGGGGGNVADQFGSGLSRNELSAVLHERREAALEQARRKRAAALEQERRKTEREGRLKVAAEVARACTSARPASAAATSGNRLATRDPNRLHAPTESSQNRQLACSDPLRGGETDGNLKARMLSRDGKAPYLTPRTFTAHKGRPYA